MPETPRNPYVGSTLAIPRIQASCARFPTGKPPQAPVIVVDAVDPSRASYNWSIDYLRRRIGHYVQPVEYSLRPVFHPSERVSGSLYHRKLMRLQDSLRLIETQRYQRYWYYISTIPLSELPEIESDLRRPEYVQMSRYRSAALFVGNDGTGTQFHYDLTTNFMAVFAGCKRVRLIAPSLHGMYPLGVRNRLCNFSRLNFDAPDPARFSQARDFQLWEADIYAGEVLYIPSLWWHQVLNVGLTMGVTFVCHSGYRHVARWQWLRLQLAHRLMPGLGLSVDPAVA